MTTNSSWPRPSAEVKLLAGGTDRKSKLITEFVAVITAANESSDESEEDSSFGEGWGSEEVLAFLFLEELAVTFQVPLKGALFRTSYRSVADCIPTIFDHANSVLVLETLENCMFQLVKEDRRVNLGEVSSRDRRLSSDEVGYKIRFWSALVGEAEHSKLKEAFLEWTLAWKSYRNMDEWNASKHRRQLCCNVLIDAADNLETLADAFRWNDPECEEDWLDQETLRLIGLYEAHPRKRKEVEGSLLEEEEKKLKQAGLAASGAMVTADKAAIEAEKVVAAAEMEVAQSTVAKL